MTQTLASVLHDHRRLVVATLQLGLFAVSTYVAWLLRFDFVLPMWAASSLLKTLPFLLIIRGLVFIPFHLYEGLWRYTSVYDLKNLAGGIAVSSIAFAIFVVVVFGLDAYPRAVFLIDALVLTLLLGLTRMARRVYLELATTDTLRRRVLVYGAGDAGAMIARQMLQNSEAGYLPVAFVDDAAAKYGRSIHGVKVYAGGARLAGVIERHQPDEVLIAIPTAEPSHIREIVNQLAPFNLPIRTLPHLRDIIGGHVSVGQIRDLSVEDLLTRAPVGLDPEPVRALIAGRRVMITGAGGSIGSELCRQVLSLEPESLMLFERYENSLHYIAVELADRKSRTTVTPVIGDVSDRESVERAFRRFRPEIVFHAAAHKHVPLMESNPTEAIKNNVRGTRILAECASAAGVEKFVLISTDKAVNPCNVMGASKRLAEAVVRQQSRRSRTAFVIVRFGNVLGSNGSVVPRFLEQIKTRQPVTVTHPEVRRFFMSIPEAVQLVLHAVSRADPSSTYMLDMGEQLLVLDVAKNLIRLSGLVPDVDVPIHFTGLRPGEKLAEELYGTDEESVPSGVEKVFKLVRREPDPVDQEAMIADLERMALDGDRDGVITLLAARVYSSVPDAEQR